MKPNKKTFLHCASCGSMTLKEHETKAVRCLDCGFTFFLNPAAAVGCIIEVPNGILLTRRGKEPKKGSLDFAGGFCDYDESLEEAVRREVEEELNLTLSNLRYFASFPNQYSYGGVIYPTLDCIFIATNIDLSTLKLDEEILAIETVDLLTLKWDEIGFPSVRAALELYFLNLIG